MHILVTGGSGFIGTNLIAFLVNSGHSVRSIDIAHSIVKQREADYRHGSIVLTPDRLDLAMQDIDVVVHLAAISGLHACEESPRDAVQTNIIGSYHVLQTAAKHDVSHVIGASASGADFSRNVYQASKRSMEAIFSAWHHCNRVPCTILRFTNIYGPWSHAKSTVVAAWIRAIRRGLPIEIAGSPGIHRDFVHVRDICRTITAAADSQPDPDPLLIGSGVPTTLGELADVIEQAHGDAIQRRSLPGPDTDSQMPPCADKQEIKRRLGIQPETNLETGMQETYQWFERMAHKFWNPSAIVLN